ncbi:hypothetical protein [Chondromyces apiculatus]|uniref:Uncharacterized protein n=1 Tax=Chondromyces apiculatus DSM 436 TaxID=1192034 RepID=A0A017SYB8_9BACT|nr:hypothetical protein [Chondromyces apiculatus]EYF01301.1 Hypothetical protein CAP_8455 [Chondromyces apiculatus DSM 436]
MVAFTREQVATLRRTLLDDFAEDTEAFLRRHFEPRLRACASADVREAVVLAHAEGGAHALRRRGEIRIYLACACVAGLFLFDDPRCLWLFHEEPTLSRVESVTNFSIRTFARNLGAPAAKGFFAGNPLEGFEETVRAAEQHLVHPDHPGLKRALVAMTPAREAFVATPHVEHFLRVAQDLGERQGLRERALTRYILLAWLFGVRFVEDPLCRPVMAFLDVAARGSAAPGGVEVP